MNEILPTTFDVTNGAEVAQNNFNQLETRALLHAGKCRVATAAALPTYTRSGENYLVANVNGSINGTGIDGVTDLALDERVLVKDEAAQECNGFFYVFDLGDGSTPWILKRTLDGDASKYFRKGVQVTITEGTANKGTTWQQNSATVVTLNTDAITFEQIGSGGIGTAVTAGYFAKSNGSTLVDGEIHDVAGPNDGIQVDALLHLFAVVNDPYAVALNANNIEINVLVSFLILTSDDVVATNRVFTLSDGYNDANQNPGFRLTLYWNDGASGFSGKLVNAPNVQLNADWIPSTTGEILELIYYASLWTETGRFPAI